MLPPAMMDAHRCTLRVSRASYTLYVTSWPKAHRRTLLIITDRLRYTTLYAALTKKQFCSSESLGHIWDQLPWIRRRKCAPLPLMIKLMYCGPGISLEWTSVLGIMIEEQPCMW